ncbi:transcriptional regulator%2C CdaR [Mycobacteroides abscessus]|nr:transcriptional regulator%2C CdaR [Mycobacteroides abscessus]
MPDNPATAPRGFRAARKPRERAEVPEALLHRIKQYSGRLSTEAVHVMEDRLPFFTDLEASQRASVALVVQTAINNFVEWIRDPEGTVGFTMQAFEGCRRIWPNASHCGTRWTWCAPRWSSSKRCSPYSPAMTSSW